MEQMTAYPTTSRARRIGAGVLTAAIALAPVHTEHAAATTVGGLMDAGKSAGNHAWDLKWQDSFDGDTLSDRWQIMDDTSVKWDRFSQYRQFAVTVHNGKLVVTSRRHCLAPGEEMSLANAQVEQCPAGTATDYSSGRIEQVTPDISGDYLVEVTAKMKIGDGEGNPIGSRGSVWMVNLDKEPESGNEGYCIEGSSTPTGEVDSMEAYGDDKARASHHVNCENGELAEVPRVKRFESGWLKKLHVYSAMKIKNRTTLGVDGEPLRVAGKGKTKRYYDKPGDFEGVTRAEYDNVYSYKFGMIVCTRVFDDPLAAPPYREPDPAEPFPPQHVVVQSIKVFEAAQ